MEPLIINSSRGVYSVTFVPEIETLVQTLGSIENSLLVLDSRVASFYGVHLKRLLEAKPHVIVVATEDEKSLAGCEKILAALVAGNGNRDTKLIAIGGGIIQDLVTMCAHIYFRGISWIFVPTTLLAMADSCIGAKASINFRGYKNQLGVFHSPADIYISPEFLKTVPEDELRSGYGEVFKLHFADAPKKFFELAQLIDTEGWRTPSLGKIIRASLEIKKVYIEKDEFDTGIRRHLNYGHTFGHALESITNHRVPHGLAVSWGMDLINFIAYRLNRIDEGLFADVHAVLKALFHWRLADPISVDALLDASRRDKKASSGRMVFVMPSADGSLEIVKPDGSSPIPSYISEYMGNYSIIAS